MANEHLTHHIPQQQQQQFTATTAGRQQQQLAIQSSPFSASMNAPTMKHIVPQHHHNQHQQRYAEWHADTTYFQERVSPMPWRKESLPAMAFGHL
jgi:hypothetical protein